MRGTKLRKGMTMCLTASLVLGSSGIIPLYATEQVNGEVVEINEVVEEVTIESELQETEDLVGTDVNQMPEEEIETEEAVVEIEEIAEEDVIVEEFVADEMENMNLPFNTVATCYVSQSNREQRYVINVSQVSRVEINVAAYMQYGMMKLYAQDGTQLDSNTLNGGSTNSPKNQTYYYTLEPGVYYIDLLRDGRDGQYQVMVGCTAIESNEQESNNGTLIAQVVQADGGVIKGTISETDGVDVYRVDLPKSGRLSLNVESCIYESYFRLGDANRNYIINKYMYYGRNDNPVYYNTYADLEAGSYYIYIDKYSGYTGRYQFKLGFEAANSDDMEPNNGSLMAQKLSLDGRGKKGFISYNDSIDVYRIDVVEADQIDISINSMIDTVKLTLTNDINQQIFYKYVSTGSVQDPVYYSRTVELQPGTYYLRVEKNNGTGLYQIDAYSKKQIAIIDSIRREKIRNFVGRMYRCTMEREPDAGGLNYWVQALENGTTTGYSMADFFINSEEFLNKGLNNSDYLDIMYNAFFGRTPDAGGKAYWMNRLEQGDTRQNIFMGFAYSDEYRDICAEYGIAFM